MLTKECGAAGKIPSNTKNAGHPLEKENEIMAKIAPSILSADFANLERDIHNIEQNGADWVHVDVMDGIFVPNISIGIPVVKALRPVTRLPLDVHLMIDRPIRYVEDFVKAGADWLTIHVEADQPQNTLEALDKIRAHHCENQDYCSLEQIHVGTHECHPAVDQCTDCKSFRKR